MMGAGLDMGDAGPFLAKCQFFLCIGAAVGYAVFARDWRHAIYWAGAAIVTGAVTW